MKRSMLLIALSLFTTAMAQAAQVSLPDTTLVANQVVPDSGGGTYGAAVVTTELFDAQNVNSVVIQGSITGLEQTQQNRSFLQVNLLPRALWSNETGAWNTGVYLTSWEAQGDGLSLATDGVGGPFVWPLQNASTNKPWHFTLTLTPTGASGGTATFAVEGQTLLGDTSPLPYLGDFSDAVLAVQYISTVQNATASFVNLTATTTPLPALLLGDANGDGVVDEADLLAVQQHFGQTGASNGSLLGDANHDGRVDAADFLAVERNFGQTLAVPAPHTPEPTSGAALLALAVGGLLRRR